MQTHSATTVGFGLILPNGSALWRPHRLKSRPRRHQSGGIALHEGSTRRRHAARRLRVVQNPHHHLHGEHQGYGGPGRSACERQKPGNRTQGRPHFRYKTLPAHPPSPHIRYKTLPAHPKWLNLALFLHAGRVIYRSHHQEAKQGELCTVLTTKKPSRANCVPNARQRSSEPTQQHSWPHRCEARRRGRSTSPRCRWAAARTQPNKFRT